MADQRTLESEHGHVWTHDALLRDFEPFGVIGDRVVVRRKSDGAQGVLKMQDSPRLYYGFQKEKPVK